MVKLQSVHYDIGYPIYGAEFLNDQTLLVTGGGGEGNDEISNRLTALTINLTKKKKPIKKFRELKLPDDNDAPSCLDSNNNIILLGCNEGLDKIQNGVNHNLQKFIFIKEHLKYITATSLESQPPLESSSNKGSIYQKFIKISNDGSVAAVASSKIPTVIHILDPVNLFVRYEIETNNEVKDIDISPDGKNLTYITKDNTVEIISIITGRSLLRRVDINKNYSLNKVKFINNDHLLLGVSLKNATGVGVLKLSLNAKLKTVREDVTISKKIKTITSIDVNVKNGVIALSGNENSIILLKLQSFKKIKILSNVHNLSISKLTFSPNGSFLASVSVANTVNIIEIPDGLGIETHYIYYFFLRSAQLLIVAIIVKLGLMYYNSREIQTLDFSEYFTLNQRSITSGPTITPEEREPRVTDVAVEDAEEEEEEEDGGEYEDGYGEEESEEEEEDAEEDTLTQLLTSLTSTEQPSSSYVEEITQFSTSVTEVPEVSETSETMIESSIKEDSTESSVSEIGSETIPDVTSELNLSDVSTTDTISLKTTSITELTPVLKPSPESSETTPLTTSFTKPASSPIKSSTAVETFTSTNAETSSTLLSPEREETKETKLLFGEISLDDQYGSFTEAPTATTPTSSLSKIVSSDDDTISVPSSSTTPKKKRKVKKRTIKKKKKQATTSNISLTKEQISGSASEIISTTTEFIPVSTTETSITSLSQETSIEFESKTAEIESLTAKLASKLSEIVSSKEQEKTATPSISEEVSTTVKPIEITQDSIPTQASEVELGEPVSTPVSKEEREEEEEEEEEEVVPASQALELETETKTETKIKTVLDSSNEASTTSNPSTTSSGIGAVAGTSPVDEEIDVSTPFTSVSVETSIEVPVSTKEAIDIAQELKERELEDLDPEPAAIDLDNVIFETAATEEGSDADDEYGSSDEEFESITSIADKVTSIEISSESAKSTSETTVPVEEVTEGEYVLESDTDSLTESPVEEDEEDSSETSEVDYKSTTDEEVFEESISETVTPKIESDTIKETSITEAISITTSEEPITTTSTVSEETTEEVDSDDSDVEYFTGEEDTDSESEPETESSEEVETTTDTDEYTTADEEADMTTDTDEYVTAEEEEDSSDEIITTDDEGETGEEDEEETLSSDDEEIIITETETVIYHDEL